MHRIRTFAFCVVALSCLFLCQGARAQGTVWAWGDNIFGELGNGTYTTTYPYGIDMPVEASALSGTTAIAGGYLHSLALRSDGTVWAWGYNGFGELGNGTNANSNTPVEVSGLSGVTAIAGGQGGLHSLALKSDGTVWAWGYNGTGALGNGTYANSNTPVEVSGLSGVTAIAGGEFHSLALKSDGTVWAWGNDVYGQLGNGTEMFASNTPVEVSGISGVTAIAGAGLHSLALKSDGTVWAWGYNADGELGNGTYTFASDTPVEVSALSGVTAIAGGGFHSLALKSDGTLWAWGSNFFGELGNGTNTTTYPFGIATPVEVSGLSGVTAIGGGFRHSLALKSDGTVRAWGYNGGGQLGNGTFTDSNTPVEVSGLSGVTAIAGGAFHSLALKGATPSQAVNSLIGQVMSPGLGFSYGETTSLTAKLRAALGYLGVGDTADAIAALQAFINEVNALVKGGRLSAAAAAPLISAANGIIALL